MVNSVTKILQKRIYCNENNLLLLVSIIYTFMIVNCLLNFIPQLLPHQLTETKLIMVLFNND